MHQHQHDQKTSQILIDLKESFHEDEPIMLDNVIARLHGRGFGILLFALAAPIAIPNIPGISTIFGVLLLIPAFQLIFGLNNVWLPKKLREIKISPSAFRHSIDGALPYILKLEKFVKPRFETITQKPYTIMIGIQVAILAIIMMLPIPFANMVPAIGVVLYAIGIANRDGALIIFSNLFFIASLFVAYIGIGAGLAAIGWVSHAIYHIF